MGLSYESYSHSLEMGCDEAGRGCLAGPVFAAAVSISSGFFHPDLNDSKKMSEKKRNLVRKYIESNSIWGVAHCSPAEIDQINILNASIKAMHKAVKNTTITPKHLLIDGNRFKPYQSISYTTVIKGDSLWACIAAASVLAKTHRDIYMIESDKLYPQYHFAKNKGYPTKEHIEALKKFGPCPIHRKSFLKNFINQTLF